MPSDEQKRSRETDEKTISQAGLSATAEPHAQSQKFLRTFLEKMAIAVRLFGKELYGLRLNRLDLAKADRRLGAKAYATGTAEGQAELVSKLDRVTGRVTQLRAKGTEPHSTFSGKAKAVVSATAKAAQIAALRLKRRRILRQLGAKLRQNDANSSWPEEARHASAVADRITLIDAEITRLRAQTYLWARRPLLAACVMLALFSSAITLFKTKHSTGQVLESTQSSRSETSAAPRPTFGGSFEQNEKLAEQSNDKHRRDVLRRAEEEVQRQVAAAEQAYREQQERQRAEVEKKQREEAQEREQVATARAKAEAEKAAAQKAAKDKEKEAGRIAASRERQEGAKGKQAGGGNESDKTVGLAAMIAALAVQESNNAAAQPSASPRKSESSRSTETPAATKLREAAEKFTVGRYAEAFKTYEEAISLDPDSPKGYLARGWALFSTSQKDAALKDFDEAIKRAPKDAEGYFRRGLLRASASEHEKAVTDFTKAIECRPDYREAYYERGVSRAATKQFDQAREDFDNVIRRDAKNALAYLNRGRVLLESRETEKALSDFNRAIELSDHEPAVFLARGAAYLQLGKYEDGQKDLEQAILLNREFVPAYNKLAEVFSARKNEALAALNRGRAYFYLHEYPRATAEFERAAQLQPKLAAAHLELGRSKSAQGIMEIAVATDTRHRGEESTQEDEKIERADVHIRDQFSKPATESLKEAARLDPQNAEIQLELGKAYFYWDSVSAIVAFEKAVQLDSKSAEPRFWLGVTKCTWGDNREVWRGPGTRDEFRARLALQDLNAAIEVNPRHAGAYYFRGTAHRTLKQYDDAIADFEAAVDRASPASHYLEYAAILYAPYKRASHSVEKVPEDLVATSLKAAALAQRAQVYCDEGQYQSALADSDQVIRALPTDPKVFHLRAHVHNKAGDAAGALADLRRAAQLAPGDKYYAHMVEETLKDQARIKGSELSFWEKAVLAMGTAIVVEAGIEMLGGDSQHRSSTGERWSGPTVTRKTCSHCGGTGYIAVRDYPGSISESLAAPERRQVCWACGGMGYVSETNW